MNFCTYLTIYSGNKMPPFYIGYSSIKKINEGYKGSVNSKCYRIVWKSELKLHPELFKTNILTIHEKRQDAINRELRFQWQLKILTNPNLYINRSIGRHVNNKGRKFTLEHKQKLKNALKGRKVWNKGLKTGKLAWNSGLTKYTSEKVAQMGLNHGKAMKGKKNPKHSEILKQKYANGWAPRKCV